jgi:hypothetical protein
VEEVIAKYKLEHKDAARQIAKKRGSAEFVPFKLCGSLFEKHPHPLIALAHRSVLEGGKNRRLSKPESLRYRLLAPDARIVAAPVPDPMMRMVAWGQSISLGRGGQASDTMRQPPVHGAFMTAGC